jgi:hypothetical protein
MHGDVDLTRGEGLLELLDEEALAAELASETSARRSPDVRTTMISVATPWASSRAATWPVCARARALPRVPMRRRPTGQPLAGPAVAAVVLRLSWSSRAKS